MDYIMKKLIIAIGILLLTTSVFAHPFSGLLGYFHNKPAYTEFKTLQEFRAMLENPNMITHLNKHTYSFFSGEKFYMLSYDTSNVISADQQFKIMKKVERGLFLFRLDASGWTKACEKPLQVDYENCSAPNEPYVAYLPWRVAGDRPEDQKRFTPAKNGSVTIADDGRITIVLVNHTNTKYAEVNKLTYFNTMIVLIPSIDGTYTLQ
jgi:hypothetical protein